MTMGHMTREEAQEARIHIRECNWTENDLDPSGEWIDEMTDDEVQAGIERHYSGGMRGFRADIAG